ncbi:hypothetical protein GOP47_0007430, partial [Adiantum capillus-veneris]
MGWREWAAHVANARLTGGTLLPALLGDGVFRLKLWSHLVMELLVAPHIPIIYSLPIEVQVLSALWCTVSLSLALADAGCHFTVGFFSNLMCTSPMFREPMVRNGITCLLHLRTIWMLKRYQSK